jgi:hypothetical protein
MIARSEPVSSRGESGSSRKIRTCPRLTSSGSIVTEDEEVELESDDGVGGFVVGEERDFGVGQHGRYRELTRAIWSSRSRACNSGRLGSRPHRCSLGRA